MISLRENGKGESKGLSGAAGKPEAEMRFSKCPPHFPPVFWKWIGWYRVTVAVLTALSPIVLLYAVAIRRTYGLGTAYFSISLAYLILAPRLLKRLFYFRIAQRGFLVCSGCGYWLRDCPSGACPECGVAFQSDKLCECWKKWFSTNCEWDYTYDIDDPPT